jgi:alpha-1,2-mannosyltransferase
VGNADDAGNQSLSGALGRLLHEHHLGLAPMGVVAVVALLGLLLAARASRRGDEAAGFGLCAVTTLLASPVSWTHHWTLAVPAVLLLALGAYERRAMWMWACAGIILLLGYSYLPELLMLSPHPGVAQTLHRALIRMHPRWLPMLARDAYVLVGLAAILVAAQRAGSRGEAPRTPPGATVKSSVGARRWPGP